MKTEPVIKPVTLEALNKILTECSNGDFNMALLFNQYFKDSKKHLVDNLKESKFRSEDIGIIDFLGIVINKINLIQEGRDEN